ncbi:MAG: class I SAM-dependent methyltransferase [Lachnospiraceae bacterium]|nr:class I SAM-dependent methyltransferase [Lachnospiraceae bacterium]
MYKTLDYYDNNAQKFVSGTLDVEFTETQDKFLSYLPESGMILDFGCGSGRDTRYFLSNGYKVDAVDGSETLCKIAAENTGIKVRQMLFSQLDEREKYDGIWACASVLHLTKDELRTVLNKMIRAVKPNGYIYISFKYGEFEGYRGERYFTDFTENTFNSLLTGFSGIKLIDEWISSDVRPGRGDEKWLNIILQKSITF